MATEDYNENSDSENEYEPDSRNANEYSKLSPAVMRQKWEKFLAGFVKQSQDLILKQMGYGTSAIGFYQNIIESMAGNGATVLIVDYDDITDYVEKRGANPEVLPLLQCLAKPDEAIDTLRRALIHLLPQHYVEQRDIENNIRVGFRNLPWYLDIPNVNHDLVNTFVFVEGFITKVDEMPRHLFIRTALRCRECDVLTEVVGKANNLQRYKCSNCKHTLRASDYDITESVASTYQEITVQQRPDSTKPGRIAADISIRAVGKDMMNAVKGGDYVRVCGILRIDMETSAKGKNANISPFYIEASSIEIQPEDIMLEQDTALEDAVMDAIRPETEDEDFEKIWKSVCPSIRGHEASKKAITCLMAGALAKKNRVDGTRHRGDINLLLVGDKSTAKTTLAKWCMQVMPRAVWNSGRGSSAAGLTAGVTFVDGVARLEAGAYLLASGGVIVCDEVRALKGEVLEQLKELMDDTQTMTIRKGGLHKQMPVRCASFHMCNPVGGAWDADKSFLENVGLEAPLVSRYDLVFVFRDVPDKEVDEKNYDHYSKAYSDSIFEDEYDVMRKKERGNPNVVAKQMKEKYWSTPFMAHWVRYIRSAFRPKIDTGSIADKTIKRGYLRLRGIDPGAMSDKDITKKISTVGMRQIGGLYRLAEASARAHHRNIVTAKDAELAIELLQASIASSGFNLILSGEAAATETAEKSGKGKDYSQSTSQFEKYDARREDNKEFLKTSNTLIAILRKLGGERCPRCNGSGDDPEYGTDCPDCDNRGMIGGGHISKNDVFGHASMHKLRAAYVEHCWKQLIERKMLVSANRLNFFRVTQDLYIQLYKRKKGRDVVEPLVFTPPLDEQQKYAAMVMKQVNERYNISEGE